MKPTTKLHHKVLAVSEKLSPLTENAKALAIKNVFEKFGTTSRKTIFCLECTHSWKDEKVTSDLPKSLVCPSCNATLKMKSPSTEFRDVSYFNKIESKDNFQVVRIFIGNKYMRKNQPPIISITEVMQHFIGLDGRITSTGMAVNGMVMYFDSWQYGSKLSIMANNFHETNRGRIEGIYTLPRPTVLKEIKRNGFNGNFYDVSPQDLFSLIIKYTHVETLLKSGHTSFVSVYSSRGKQIAKYWNSIKIAIRNNYKIEDATIWLDYVQLLESFGKDLSSSKYVCPTDLNKAHDKLVEKKRRINQKLDLIELKKKIKDQEKSYKKEKSPYFGISFSNGAINISVFNSVTDIMNEGKELNHCVYENEYFSKKNSLLFSAKVDGARTETIEFSLSEMKILQARGLQNKASAYNKEIKELIYSNLNQIEKITNLKSA